MTAKYMNCNKLRNVRLPIIVRTEAYLTRLVIYSMGDMHTQPIIVYVIRLDKENYKNLLESLRSTSSIEASASTS